MRYDLKTVTGQESVYASVPPQNRLYEYRRDLPVELPRLVSLLEIMRNFNAWELAMLLRHIDTARRHAQAMCESGGRDDKMPEDSIQQFIKPILLIAETSAKRLELDSTWKRVWDGGGPFYFSVGVGITYQQLVNELDVLRQAIEADLEERTFVFIPRVDAEVLQRMKDTWSNVWEVIPDSHRDVREALSCYALDRHTAAVFHAMRIAEHGLRHLARKLHVRLIHSKKTTPIEFADWAKIITAIKNKIDPVGKRAPSKKRQELLEKYSDAADHCVFMKDIWRNNVSHTRDPYKKPEALGVIERVRDFMQFVATNFK